MENYENLILEKLAGETPKLKYDFLISLIKKEQDYRDLILLFIDIQDAKQFAKRKLEEINSDFRVSNVESLFQ